MATLIGEYGTTHSAGFHTMIATQGLPYAQQHHHQGSPRYRSDSHSRDTTPRRPLSSRQQSPPTYTVQGQSEWDDSSAAPGDRSGASRLPSPPDSSSPSGSAASAPRSDDNLRPQAQHGQTQAYMDSLAHPSAQGSSAAAPTSSASTKSHNQSLPQSSHVNQTVLPSPASDAGRRWSSAQTDSSLAIADAATQQTTIHVRDLAHIQALARTDMNTTGTNDPPLQAMKYEISGMPIGDVIEMVAALLTKITTTNDLQHDALSRNAIERNASHVKQAQAQNEGSATENSMSPLSSSVLAFHGKNVPAITILSYLSRIHKYCPTTYEVFLSLLVYFDRMTERVNDLVMKAEEAKKQGQRVEPHQSDVVMKDDDDSSDSDVDEDIADDEDSDEEDPRTGASSAGDKGKTASELGPAASQPTFFVVDSFNIHRLIIAGVTCASKFFSDVFYTNSRYAKVRFPTCHLACFLPFTALWPPRLRC